MEDGLFEQHPCDAVFAIQPNLEGARALYDDIKRAAVDYGRPSGACKLLFGVQPMLLAVLLIAVLLLWRHRANIARLRAGTEGRVFGKKSPGGPS